MRDPDQDSSDDELCSWFVRSIGLPATEVRDGVIDVVIEDEDGPSQRVEILLTRAQLREAAYAEEDISDDTHDGEPGGWPAKNPVLAGLRNLSIFLDEALATLRPDEKYVVLHDGQFWASVRPDVPPVRGSDPDEGAEPLTGADWRT
jgi:hypothetical protein